MQVPAPDSIDHMSPVLRVDRSMTEGVARFEMYQDVVFVEKPFELFCIWKMRYTTVGLAHLWSEKCTLLV